MLTVNFRSWGGDNDGKVVGAIALLDTGKLYFDERAKVLLADTPTIIEPDTLEPLTAKDGERFLRALPYNFSGSYFRAEIVE